MAASLADLVVRFVNTAYSQDEPAAFAQLLLPSDEALDPDRVSLARKLWSQICSSAADALLLPNTCGVPCMRLQDALLLSVSTSPEYARAVLRGSPLGERLLHKDIDANAEAHRALQSLGCAELRDDDIIEAIQHRACETPTDAEWVWHCWLWLSGWSPPRGLLGDRSERVARIAGLPILPVNQRLLTPASQTGSIVTWRTDGHPQEELPQWLPLTLVDDWFRDRVIDREPTDPVTTLRSELGVKPPGDNAILSALEKAIDDYWRGPDDRPERFLHYVLSRNWDPSVDLTSLSRCPVPTLCQGKTELEWVCARDAYFGTP